MTPGPICTASPDADGVHASPSTTDAVPNVACARAPIAVMTLRFSDSMSVSSGMLPG